MAEAITIARPYANAAFSLAQEKGELAAWSDLLAVLAQAVSQPEMQSIINSPAVSDEQAVSVLADIAGDAMTTEMNNFVSLLAENDRLILLADVSILFEELKAEAEKSITADIVTARDLTAEQAEKISAALKNRLGRDVTLNVSVDESLLGGAIIRAGDLVIDGSALGKLNRLASAIN
jgi:F-type H+-transporting ATPase subunit delta